MRSDELVSLWTYGSQTAMQSDGSRPLPLYFRVPPDLYYGERQNLKLRLSYRYDAAPLAPGSALRVFINGLLINEAPMPPGPSATDNRREVLVPILNMRPSANTLLFNFDFIRRHRPGYLDTITSHLDGEILHNSSLDIRGVDHWVAMPNLELFANAGFPFTQRADLSQTVVLLPTHPSPREIALFLHLMSHCGSQTGYPVLRVELAPPNAPLRSDRDYLVLGTLQNQPEFAALEGTLPASFDAAGLHLQPQTGLVASLRQAWRTLLRLPDESGQLLQRGSAPDAVLEGISLPMAPDTPWSSSPSATTPPRRLSPTPSTTAPSPAIATAPSACSATPTSSPATFSHPATTSAPSRPTPGCASGWPTTSFCC